jgi:hypothetical protein
LGTASFLLLFLEHFLHLEHILEALVESEQVILHLLSEADTKTSETIIQFHPKPQFTVTKFTVYCHKAYLLVEAFSQRYFDAIPTRRCFYQFSFDARHHPQRSRSER